MSDILLLNACVIAGLMLTVWLISLPLKDVSIVDITWGLGFVLVAWDVFPGRNFVREESAAAGADDRLGASIKRLSGVAQHWETRGLPLP